ncbi:NUDIX domain-containing protein [Nocardiopsis terrae]
MDLATLVGNAHLDGIGRFSAGAIVHRAGRILLLRRRPDDTSYPGAEDLPSGGVEPGEGLLEGLERELAEEIGRPPGPPALDPFVTWFDYDSRSGIRTRQFTFALPHDGSPVVLSGEHTAFRWAPAGEYPDSELTPRLKEAVRDWLGSR